MSLFPAYSTDKTTVEATTTKTEGVPPEIPEPDWLSNPSFKPLTSVEAAIDTTSQLVNAPPIIEPTTSSPKKSKQKRKHKDNKASPKKKKKQKHGPKDEIHPRIPSPINDFTGNEEYYVDKLPVRGYLNVHTLHRPACPKYKIYLHSLGHIRRAYRSNKFKRYYIKSKKDKIQCNDRDDPSMIIVDRMDETEYVNKNKSFNRKLGENPGDITLWLDFVQHQDFTHMKSTKIQIVERKIDILEKALRENPSNERLYRLYVEIIDQTYPSFEVSKILDKMLARDPTNYILWMAQILATQGSMARCIVPDVLKLYEKCMKSMYQKNRYDDVMLKLFTNCCLFLRQSGLYEQFFALIKLALELNISSDKFTRIQPSEDDQTILIEYEEVILKSGLPMNEIWLRIEKLRQNFYFLPCPDNRTCSDPVRIVFNEDIVHFVYPLVRKEYCFNLAIIIIKLLKIPLPGHSIKHCFFTKQENYSEFDSIEEILPMFLYRNTFSTMNHDGQLVFDKILFDMIKEFSIGPSYIVTHIGHEIYLSVISEILLLCSDCFDMQHLRNIFILIWLKFQRILLKMNSLQNGDSNDDNAAVKKIRTRIKNLLKQEQNRNVLIFYTEYALIEHELGNVEQMEKIFHTALGLTKPTDDDCTKSEYYSTYIAYVECLLENKCNEKALKMLTNLALDQCIDDTNDAVSETRKLMALKKITDRLSDLIFIERNVNIMELEQSFMPDYLISLIKVKIYYLCLAKSRKDAFEQIEVILRTFCEPNNRHTFVRENLYELYVNVMQMQPVMTDGTYGLLIVESNRQMWAVLQRGLEEFPNNFCLLRVAATMDGQTWHKIRTILTKQNSPISIVFLVAAAKYQTHKFIQSLQSSATSELNQLSSNIDANEYMYKIRVCNMLKSVTGKNSPTRKNSLLWRLYLRSLLDVHKDFDKSRNTLFAALDECPWNKALYLDGTVYIPQELPHIQDLIIEKQLRMYALPEELEILRDDNITVK